MRTGICLAILLAANSQAATLCEVARLDRLPVCVETAGGVILAINTQEAEALGAAAESARPMFRVRFGHDAPRYAVVQNEASAEEIGRLKDNGFPVVLPLPSKVDLIAQIEPQVRSAVEEQLPEASDAEIDSLVAEIVDRQVAAVSGVAIVAHELGHLWLQETFWPGAPSVEGQYGGPAPDWLEEVAAVLMETELLSETRRAAFFKIWQQGLSFDLAAFFAMEHPAKLTADAARKAGRAIVKVGSAADGPTIDAFYAKSRVFADFLIDVTDQEILASIAEAAAQGLSMDQWLAAQGNERGLPSDLKGLELAWREWVTSIYGPPG